MIPTKKYLLNGLLIFIGLFVSVLLSELTLRFIDFSHPNFFEYDNRLGSRHYPGAEGWWRKEGEAYIEINNDGLRDYDYSKVKPQNVFRVAILGDSYAAALQVSIENTFWSIVEQRLNHCKKFENKKVEVINFGVSGYGTAQELLMFKHHATQYSPDIVLLAFLTGNDLRNNTKSLEPIKQRPFFVLKDEQLMLDDTFVTSEYYKSRTGVLRSFHRWLTRHSRALQLLEKIVLKILVKTEPEGNDQEIGLNDEVYVQPTASTAWDEAWKVTQALLTRFRDEVERQSSRFVLVTLSNSIQVHPNPAVRTEFTKALGAQDLFYPDRRLRAFAQREGIEIITLAPIFQRFAEENATFLHGFKNARIGSGHWNHSGHLLAGELIAQYLCHGDSIELQPSESLP